MPKSVPTFSWVCLACLLAAGSGCGTILGMEYSEQQIGVERHIPDTVEKAIEFLGRPDVHYRFREYRILGWKKIKSYGIGARFSYPGTYLFLPVAWSRFECTSVGILADENGKVISKGKVLSGKGYTILGAGTAPVAVRSRNKTFSE